MKILYASNLRFPSERAHSAQIAHMCQAFSESGASVTLVTNNRGKECNVNNYFGFVPKFEHFRVNGNIFFLPNSKIFFLINNIFFLIQLRRNFFLKNYDVIYVRDEWLALFLSKIISVKKVIFESHEAKFSFAVKKILNKGVSCIVITEGIRDYYIEKGISKSQLLVAEDGIDESFFGSILTKEEARKKLDLPQDEKIAMYIGGFDAWKGIETFFRASEYSKNIMFVAVGGKEAEIEEFSSKYKKVNFLGPRQYKELKDIQQSADVLVIPNTAKNDLAAKYTSPLKLFAHLASGVPLVVSNVQSLKLAYQNGCISFEADSCVSLSRAIKFTLEKWDFYKENSERLKEYSKQFTWVERAKKIINFHENLSHNPNL